MTKKDMELVPYNIVKGANGDAWVKAGGADYSPSQLSAFILQQMTETAAAYPREQVEQAVLPVPPYFNNAQPQATQDPGNIPRLHVPHTTHHPPPPPPPPPPPHP